MSDLVPIQFSGNAMPVVDIGNGETVSAAEFFTQVQRHAPIALQHQRWLQLARYAFDENNADALLMAKQQAQQLQRGGSVGNVPMGMVQPFPTTYQQLPTPIVFQPQIHITPTIAPSFTNSPTQTATSDQTSRQTSRHEGSSSGYYDDTHPFVVCCWVLLSLVAAFMILVSG